MKRARVFGILFCSFSVFFSLSFGIKNIKNGRAENVKEQLKEKEIISVWQIDGFYAGSGSKRDFLLYVAKEFEKKNDCLIMVNNYSLEGAEEKMNEGIFPDIISFSYGLNLKNLKELNTKKRFINFINGKNYALPWCRGGYVLITNPNSKNNKLIISKQQNFFPEVNLLYESESEDVKSITLKSPDDAYKEFILGGYKYLLSSERDIIRLEKRGFDFSYRVLENYNDLYQYVAITSTLNTENSQKYINLLLDKKYQEQLNRINMCSAFYSPTFTSKGIQDIQNAKYKKTLSPFLDITKMSEVTGIVFSDLSRENKLSKINKVLSALS